MLTCWILNSPIPSLQRHVLQHWRYYLMVKEKANVCCPAFNNDTVRIGMPKVLILLDSRLERAAFFQQRRLEAY